jgi:hypothetical protein
MVYSRWFEMLAGLALLGLVLFTAGATPADIPAGGAPDVAFSHCLEGLRQETGSVLPSQLADRDTCAQLEQIDASLSSADRDAALAGRAGFNLISVALAAPAATWRDAGATRLRAAAAATAAWGDAGAARPQATLAYYTPGDDWMDVGARQR